MARFPKTTPGVPFTQSPAFNAAWCNSVSEAADAFHSQQAAGSSSKNSRYTDSSSGIVSVRNLTGGNVLRGNYVQLGDYLLDEVNHRDQWYEGNLYDAAESGRVAIVTAAIVDGKIGPARILGKCTALVNVTDIGHRFAAPADGGNVLVSSASGDIEILSPDMIDGTGERELAVVMGIGGGGAAPNIKYIQVTEINEGPNDGDDFTAPYQPVYVRELTLQGYEPATSGPVTTDNTDIEITSTKGHKKHGTRGNGVTVEFVIDAGITPDAEAEFDEAADELTIKVKSDAVAWSAVSTAVGLVLDGAFSLVADDPDAEVGSGIESVTASLASGADGDWAMSGSAFTIGNLDTKNHVKIGQRREIIRSDSSGAWELLDDAPLIKYVEVIGRVPDPEEEDEYPEPLQPTIVKELFWKEYEPATSGTVETDNTTIVISTHKGGIKHGTRGNGIDVTFEVDAVITPQSEVEFDEEADVLSIKVKTTDTLWSDVSTAVAACTISQVAQDIAGSFSLIADNPTEEVGENIASVTASLTGGENGDYDTDGPAFAVGDHDTAQDLGDKLFVIWNGTAQKWEILGGAGGGKRIALLLVTDEIPERTGGTPGSSTDYTLVDGDEPEGSIKNWSTVVIGTGAYVITVQIGELDVIVQAFC